MGDDDGEEDEDGSNDDDDNSQENGSSSEEDGSEDDDDSDNNNNDNTEGDGEDNQNNNNNDGLSEYERLRLARIQRNQKRLAALGLVKKGGTNGNRNGGGGGLFGPTDAEAALEKRKRSKKKIIDPNAVPIEPTRTNLSRSSKKRIDYAEKQKLTEETPTKKKKKKGESSFYPAVFSSLGFQLVEGKGKKDGTKKKKNRRKEK